MISRVETRIGKVPCIIVAPHGPDDVKSDLLAESVAEQLDCFAVINKGFERHAIVDSLNDKADCNRIDHLKETVVHEEFLKPILKYVELSKKMLNINDWSLPDLYDNKVFIFYIHGCGQKNLQPHPCCIVGYGNGFKKDSLTCERWAKNCFRSVMDSLFTQREQCYEGKGGGKYAGRSANNLNQYFRKHDLDPWVDTMQLEIPYNFRARETERNHMSKSISLAIDNILRYPIMKASGKIVEEYKTKDGSNFI